MARTELPQEWKEWVAHNIGRGCSIADLFNTLVREGFAPEAAERELNLRRVALKRFPSDRLELYTAESFLLPEECEELIDIIKRRLRPSTISHDGTAAASFRTSRTCDLVGGEPAVRGRDGDRSRARRGEPGPVLRAHAGVQAAHRLLRSVRARAQLDAQARAAYLDIHGLPQ